MHCQSVAQLRHTRRLCRYASLSAVQCQYFERSIYSVVLMTQWVLGGANVVFVGLMPRVNQDPRGFKGTIEAG